jgi:hypothetical protein
VVLFFAQSGITATMETEGTVDAYEAGWQARLEGKPFNKIASQDWQVGWKDCNWDMDIDAITDQRDAEEVPA